MSKKLLILILILIEREMMSKNFGPWLHFYIVRQMDMTFYWPIEEVFFFLFLARWKTILFYNCYYFCNTYFKTFLQFYNKYNVLYFRGSLPIGGLCHCLNDLLVNLPWEEADCICNITLPLLGSSDFHANVKASIFFVNSCFLLSFLVLLFF